LLRPGSETPSETPTDRLVLLTTSYPRTEDDPSGHFVEASARRLAAQGHDVHVIAAGGSTLAPPRRVGRRLWVHDAGGGALFGWPGAIARAREVPWRLGAAPVFALGAAARMRALAERSAIDRVIAHWIVPCAYPIALAAAATIGARLDVVAHGADVRLLLALPSLARERIVRTLLHRGARFTFAASALRVALERALSADLAASLASRARVEPPPIDVPDVADRAAAIRASLALAEGERLVVVAARLVASKRVDLALDAVHATRAPVRIVVLGDGPERAALTGRAADLGLGPRASFLGARPRRDALAWIAAADVLLHASALEAAPTVVREARLLGTPVVACASGDLAAWAADDAGILLAEPTATALGRALDDALDDALDHALDDALEAARS
jgi:glycosyltransferase involved in cell wall biosynthesis